MSAALQTVKRFRMRELAPFLHNDAKLSNARPNVRNPFLPHKNAETGHWHPAKYSLRRQADLVKNARASGVLHLLPPGPKVSLTELAAASQAAVISTPEANNAAAEGSTAEADSQAKGKAWWGMPVEWRGEYKEKEIKGADVGNRLYAGKKRMFKGHKWERTQQERQRGQKMLMKDMKARIERFKTVSAVRFFQVRILAFPTTPFPHIPFAVWLSTAVILGILAARDVPSATTQLPVCAYYRHVCPTHDRSTTVGPHADALLLFLPDVPAQDAVAYQRRTAGVLLQASILISMLHPVAYSTTLSRTLPSHNPLLCSRPAWPALGDPSHAFMRC